MKTIRKFLNSKRYLLLRIISVLTMYSFLFSHSGCMYYYKVNTVTNHSQDQIETYQKQAMYFVLHRGDEAWHLYDLDITADRIMGKISPNLDYHINHIKPKTNMPNRYIKKKEPDVLKEVHFYTTDSSFSYFDTLIIIPVNSINKIALYDRAKGATILSWVIPPILVTGIVVLVCINIFISGFDFNLSF